MDSLQIGLQTYPAASSPVTAERLINCFAEPAPENAFAPVVVRRAPGLEVFASGLSGPVRALHTWKGSLYAIAGSRLYEINSSGSVSIVGTVQGTGAAYMESDTNLLVIVTGGDVYTYDGTTVSEITDTDLPDPVSWVEFLDQRILYGVGGAGQFYWSDVGDPTSINTLSFATAETDPDNVVRGIVQRRELYLFGERTIEVWYSTGDNDAAFLRSQGGVIERGCIAGNSIVREDNSIFWLADDLTVRRLSGVTPQRISTHAIETELRTASTVIDVSAFSYTYDGHVFYVLRIPALNRAYIYDITTQLWHERRSWPSALWRANSAAVAYGGQTFVGDSMSGTVFRLAGDVYTEGGGILELNMRTAPIQSNRRRIIMDELEVVMEPGVGLFTGQGSDPQVMRRFSDDGGKTYGSAKYRTLGQQGRYGNRIRWAGCGSFYSRTIEFSVTDPVPVTVLALNARLRGAGN